MARYWPALTLALALTALPGPLKAQEMQDRRHAGTPQQQRACRPDVLRLCRGLREDDAILACLKRNASKLTPACRKALDVGQ